MLTRSLDCNVHSVELIKCFNGGGNPECLRNAVESIIKGKKDYRRYLVAAGFSCEKNLCTIRRTMEARGIDLDTERTSIAIYLFSIKIKGKYLFLSGALEGPGLSGVPEVSESYAKKFSELPPIEIYGA